MTREYNDGMTTTFMKKQEEKEKGEPVRDKTLN
jgi:hypothetical protein